MVSKVTAAIMRSDITVTTMWTNNEV
jgi:hypothetical protein